MECRVQFNREVKGYWIIWKRLYPKYVDKWNFNNRDESFPDEWFEDPENGIQVFKPPNISFRDGVARWINGRHRTELLAKHMNIIIPMEVSIVDPGFHDPPPGEIVCDRLYETDIFDLPDVILETYNEIRKKWNLDKHKGLIFPR